MQFVTNLTRIKCKNIFLPKKRVNYDKLRFPRKQRKKMPFLAPCTHFCQKNLFLLFMLIKSTQWNNLRCFPKACTHIFNNTNSRLQGLQIVAFQQRYLKCKCETPYVEGELVPKTCKKWKMSSKKNFLSGLVTKLENLFVFGKNLWKISSNWWFQKKVAHQSHFGSNIESLL